MVTVSASGLSSSTQDYLKVIWTASEWSETPVTVTALALRMGVKTSTASESIRKLAEQGFLTHVPYGHVELTETGRRHAIEMVRRHRLLETFLVEVLGYRWDEVHDEAEVLEHAVSDTMISRIDARLNFPSHDPHGDPIPTATGEPHRTDAVLLPDATPGRRMRIARVSDSDPAMLRYFSEVGLSPNSELTVQEPRPFSGSTTIRLHGTGAEIDLGAAAAAAVWVTAV